MANPLPSSDLDDILQATAPLWEQMRGERLFITGGTGFFGAWLVESFLHCNRQLALGASVTVLSRDPQRFLDCMPHLQNDSSLIMQAGDVRSFTLPREHHAYILHAATEASAQQLAQQPHQMLTTILEGTSRTLDFAANTGARKLLLTSSGAVYGRQPASLQHMPEDFTGAPDPMLPGSVYGEGKRASELMCSLLAQAGTEIKVARCYAFIGPHLPLDAHFAAGNFLADALAGRSIAIASDGRAIRSYLYASDLAIWLWTLLFQAPSGRAYNVGSEDALSIRELAEATAAAVNPAISVTVGAAEDSTHLPHRYVPSVARARQELGLRQTVSLHDALARTAAWHRSHVHNAPTTAG